MNLIIKQLAVGSVGVILSTREITTSVPNVLIVSTKIPWEMRHKLMNSSLLNAMLKPYKFYAVVNKERPKLDLNEIYKPVDIKDIHINKDEKIIEVIIQAS